MNKFAMNKLKLTFVALLFAITLSVVGITTFAKAEVFDVSSVTLTMRQGATELTKEVDGADGLNFKAELSDTEYEGILSLVDNGTYVKMETGLIIAPNYYNDEVEINEESLFGETPTYDWAEYVNGNWVYSGDKIRVININANDWVKDGDVYTYSGGIVDILDENQEEVFFATAYVKLTDVAGVNYFIFADTTTSESVPYTEIFTLNETGDTITGLTTYGKTLTEIVIPEEINQVKITSIGSGAFDGCGLLTSVTFEEGSKLTSIGKSAFSKCYSLISVEIPSSVESVGYFAFYSCSSLTSIEIPSSVTSIWERAFSYCSSLTSVTIGNGVTSIGAGAFSYCDSLTSIKVVEDNAHFKDIDGILYTKDGKTLVQYAIGKTSTAFTIPSSVTSIGEYAFSLCSSLTSIEIPSSVTSIGEYAFSSCSKLTNVTFEEGSKLTSIGEYAFYRCYLLTSIEIPNSVEVLGDSAFRWCDSLTSITFDEDSELTSIGEYAFDGCYSLTSIEIPNSVTSIGSYAFHNCSLLTSVVIGDSVTSIGERAFSRCDLLASITFNGTMEEWNAIEKGSDWDFRVPATYVQCTDGKVALS